MTAPSQLALTGFVEIPAMTRAEWKALPTEVRAFVPWEDARHSKIVPIGPSRPLPMNEEDLLAFFSGASEDERS